MSPAPDSDDLLAAKRLLAEAEQAAIDEVLALRAAATELYQEVVALRAEAAQLVEQAAAEAERVRADQATLDERSAELDARSTALDQQALSVATPPATPEESTVEASAATTGADRDRDAASDVTDHDEAGDRSDPLVGAQAEMRALSALLDELQGRVEVLGQQSGTSGDPP